ncbi:hypothetical protein ABBQ32_001233 [Trebouxia sp. C0010 RCD-2024]
MSTAAAFSSDPQDELYDSIKDKPLHVDLVLLQKGRTRPHIIEKELLRIRDATSLDELKEKLLEAQESLEALNIFQAVQLTLDASLTGDPRSCTLKVHCPEKRIWHAHAGTFLAETEAKFEGQFGLTNALGYAERVDLTYERSNKNSTEYGLQFTRPRAWGTTLDSRASLAQHFLDRQQASSYVENYRGSTFGLSSDDGRHNIGYELAWRALSSPNRAACPSVRQQCGNHLKSALQYVYQWQRGACDDPGDPSVGVSFRSTSEVAGIGLESSLLRFARQHFQGAVAIPMVGGTSLFFQANAAAMLPWGAGWQRKPTCISDRLFLGGVGSLRGFQERQVGPSEPRLGNFQGGAGSRRDALGGDLYATVLAALRFQFPSRSLQEAGIHGHFFVNGGSLSLLSGTGRSLKQAVTEDFMRSWRWTAGVGVRWQTTIGTLEINLSQILAQQQHDKPKIGVQFGFTPPA